MSVLTFIPENTEIAHIVVVNNILASAECVVDLAEMQAVAEAKSKEHLQAEVNIYRVIKVGTYVTEMEPHTKYKASTSTHPTLSFKEIK